ncbi:MAG: hypothetical protein HY700_13765 [Gemmatimonadetes bacterium]|nr:hypothetical protein [Gemmatimonadota bacterium]
MNRSSRYHLTRWLTVLLLLAPATAIAQQQDTTLLKRWVGNYLEKPLTLEFYGDTMLVVGDRHALNYRLTLDSLIATGDTSIVARYRVSHGRLLLETADGSVITMATQKTLGRPLTGRWMGDVDTSGTAVPVELNLNPDRTACWHGSPDGKWMKGEWDRETRVVTMIWDSGEWTGLYDPQNNSLVLRPIADSTHSATGPTGALHRVFRGPAPAAQCPGR